MREGVESFPGGLKIVASDCNFANVDEMKPRWVQAFIQGMLSNQMRLNIFKSDKADYDNIIHITLTFLLHMQTYAFLLRRKRERRLFGGSVVVLT